MELREFFASVGGDCEAVLNRLPSEAMVRRFLRKFPADPSYDALHTALAAGDLATAFRAVHTIKGTAANLGLDTLASAASALTEALRGTDTLPPQTLVDTVDTAYELTVRQIAALDE